MTKAGKLIGCTLGMLMPFCSLLPAATRGNQKSGAEESATETSATSANPYQGIVDRNVFGLKPPPPPAPPPEAPKAPVNIALTGITTVLGKKRCFMTVTTSPKPGAPAVPTSMMLSENERDGEIEVVHIDPEKGAVDLKQGGSPVTITFKENGVKGGPIASNPLPTLPNPAHQPNPFIPAAYPGQKTIPGRPLRIQNPTGAQPGVNPQSGISPSANNFGGYSGSPAANNMQPQMSLVEAETLAEAGHEMAKAANDPTASMFPPTRLNPNRNVIGAPPEGAGPAQPNSQQYPGLPIPPGGPRQFRP